MNERKAKRLVLARTTLRLLSPRELKAVAGVDSAGTETTLGGQDSYRGCVQDPTYTALSC
jgi:hypothetical protein